jgi:hypothetical protein
MPKIFNPVPTDICQREQGVKAANLQAVKINSFTGMKSGSKTM